MQDGRTLAVAYAYCSFETGCTARGILRDIIRQLLAQRPELLSVVKEDYSKHRLTGRSISISTVVTMLSSIVGSKSIGETHIVIDGLDEIREEKERTTLLQELEKLPARVLIFSRPLEIHSKHLPSATVLTIHARDEDIKTYVVSTLVNHPSLQEFIGGPQDTWVREVAEKIREKSRGMYVSHSD